MVVWTLKKTQHNFPEDPTREFGIPIQVTFRHGGKILLSNEKQSKSTQHGAQA